MSTKIYNGYALMADNLDEAVKVLYKMKKQSSQYLYEQTIEKFVKGATRCLDVNVLDFMDLKKAHDPNHNTNALSIQRNEVYETIKRDKEYGEGSEYIEMNIILYPQKFTKDGQSFYLLTAHMNDEAESWLSKKFAKSITEFGYWNNSDRPEEVTGKEWAFRRTCWNKALLKASAVPTQEGISIILARLNKTYFLKGNEMEEKYKEIQVVLDKEQSWLSKNIRLKSMVNEVLEDIIFKQLRESRGIADDDMGMATYMEASRLVRKNELSPELLQEKERLEKAFSPYIFELSGQDYFTDIKKLVAQKTNQDNAVKTESKKLKP